MENIFKPIHPPPLEKTKQLRKEFGDIEELFKLIKRHV